MLGPKSCCAPASLFSPLIRHLPPKTYASKRKFEVVAATDFSVDLHTGLGSSHLMLALAETAMFRHGRHSAVDIDNSVSSGNSAAWHSASHIPSFRFVSLGMPDNLTWDMSNSEDLCYSAFAQSFLLLFARWSLQILYYLHPHQSPDFLPRRRPPRPCSSLRRAPAPKKSALQLDPFSSASTQRCSVHSSCQTSHRRTQNSRSMIRRLEVTTLEVFDARKVPRRAVHDGTGSEGHEGAHEHLRVLFVELLLEALLCCPWSPVSLGNQLGQVKL